MKNIAKISLYPFLLLNKYVQKTNWFTNTIPNKNNYPTLEWLRQNITRNYDIVNIGSSSALYAFDYSELNLKAFNWALQPQSMEYSFKILKNYHSILKHNGVVLNILCPFSGLSVEGKWNKTANDKYYYILSPSLIEDFHSVSKRRRYPLFTQPKQSIKRLLKDVPAKKGKSLDRLCNSLQDFEKDADKWINDWMHEFNIEDLNQSLSEENNKGMQKRTTLLNEMIDFCIERDLKPILVIPPMHSALANKFSEEFKENYIYSFIREANKANVPFYDYMNATEFQKDEYFTNSFFMNEKGAKQFTRSFLEAIL